MKGVLIVAFNYPPNSGSSGVQRTLKFSRYLPDCGWAPVVLTAHPRAYEETDERSLADVPAAVPVTRAFALDARRHLAVAGASLRALALPDRWSTWWLGAVPAGLRLIRKHRPAAIWSTYPIATAHLIALTLHRLTGIPWVADFRDPMIDGPYPSDPTTRRIHHRVEKNAASRAACLVFTTPSARMAYLDRHPTVTRSRCIVIPNGYDEADFEGIPDSGASRGVIPGRPLRIVHAGFVYQQDRDPRPLFRALSRLRKNGHVDAQTLRIDFLDPGSVEYFGEIVHALDIADIVSLSPAVSHHEALRECAAADALLLLQGASCDHQIPAKTYEYLRLHRPILALTGPSGDTATLVRECGGATMIDLLDEEAIHDGFLRFLRSVRAGTHSLPSIERSTRYARHRQTQTLAESLEAVTSGY